MMNWLIGIGESLDYLIGYSRWLVSRLMIGCWLLVALEKHGKMQNGTEFIDVNWGSSSSYSLVGKCRKGKGNNMLLFAHLQKGWKWIKNNWYQLLSVSRPCLDWTTYCMLCSCTCGIHPLAASVLNGVVLFSLYHSRLPCKSTLECSFAPWESLHVHAFQTVWVLLKVTVPKSFQTLRPMFTMFSAKGQKTTKRKGPVANVAFRIGNIDSPVLS